MPKIGIMGGTFNPVHNAHIEMAKKALLQFGLDKVLFITNGNPPHKKNQFILDASIRHKMVSLAIKDFPQFESCDYEINKETYCYTYETLRYLKKINKNSELYFIIGADSLHNITSWVKPRLIMEMCTLLIYNREGYDMEKDLLELKKEYYLKAKFIDATPVDISSSRIRKMATNGEDISSFLPKAVSDFILRNKIYHKKGATIKKQLKKQLSHDRFIHSVNVCNTAVELAELYGFDKNKAYVAGLLHDCAKCVPYDDMMRMCEDFDIELDDFDKINPALIHARLGEKIAMTQYAISDKEILEAIKWHTLGHPDMGDIAKIIYVADMIEPLRCFSGVEKLREIAKKDINLAVLECTNATINYNTIKNRPIHQMAFSVLDAFKKLVDI